MTTRYVGIGGNDVNSGLTWALRKLTLTGAEDTPVVAGDLVYIGPGVYREMLTVDVSGGNVYNANTVSVTRGSMTVTGAGTAFVANVAIADMFQNPAYASGNDGVANGTATFTSAGGNFQAAMIGQTIQIMTKGAYVVGAVAAANSITLLDPNGLGWPGAGGGLTYSVMSGQGPYEILSITDNTNFELVRPWRGPTLTGLSYLTYRPIRYVADRTGEHTDSIGGVVRVTASDNDQTNARESAITASAKHYRVFRGFRLDMGSAATVGTTDCANWTLEDCSLSDMVWGVRAVGANQSTHVVRRCVFAYAGSGHIYSSHSATVNDAKHLIENCFFASACTWGAAIVLSHVGGIVVRNCTTSCYYGIQITDALAVGQVTAVNNCILAGCRRGLAAIVLGEILEDYNTIVHVKTARENVGVGANSVAYPVLPALPIMYAGAKQDSGYKFPWWFGELSEWSQVRAIAGFDEPGIDLQGLRRPPNAAQNSWGPVQYDDVERETGTVHAGSVSMCFHDAGHWQMWVPVTNVSTTISVYVYREANYAGNNPQMIVKQPGQADDVTTDGGGAGGWNLLTTTLTPAALPPYVVVELVSRNTAAAGNYKTFFDDLVVS